MVEKKEMVQVIRCQHKNADRKCNNIICVREKNIVTVKRHGREVKACLTDSFPVTIVCERCGEITRIFL